MQRKSADFSEDQEEPSHLDIIGEHLFVVLIHIVFPCCVILVLSPIISLIFKDTFVTIIWLLVAFVTSPMSIMVLKQFDELGIKKLWASSVFLIRDSAIQKILLFLLNVFLFFRIGLNTMVPLFVLFGLYALFSIFYFIFPAKIVVKRKVLAAILMGPFFVNCLLTVNYALSFDPKVETYVFSFNYETVRQNRSSSGIRQRTSLIILKNNKYSAYPGIRIFWDYAKVSSASKITYTFKTGVLGIRVMTHYYLV